MSAPETTAAPSRGFRQAYARMVRYDLGLLRQHPRFVMALLAVLLVPSLYAGIYLSSMWDPASHTRGLRVALVNQDTGIDVRGRQVNLGQQLLTSLATEPTFSYDTLADPESAKAAVRRGERTFAVLIPPDFSRHAVPGEAAGAGELTVYVSEGNNYTGAGFARRFAPELARKLNHALNEQRWNAVLQTAAGATESVAQLREGVAQLVTGARQLADAAGQARAGSGKLDDGARQLAQGSAQLEAGLGQLTGASQQLTGGMKQAGGALRQMHGRMPSAAELQALKAGSQQLADGQKELGTGLRQLQQGAGQLREGTKKLGTESQKLPFGASKVGDAAGQLEAGATQLQGGLGQAVTASDRLGEGATQLAGGVGRLTDGMGQLAGGVGQLAAAMPADARLDEYQAGVAKTGQGSADLARGAKQLQGGMHQLAGGLDQLAQGSQRLADGVALLASRLPENVASLTGSASGLAESIQPRIEVVAPVANQGSGFTPNFAPIALWVGATLCTFLFAYRWLPRPLAGQPPLAVVLGKLLVPGLVLLLQTLILLAMLFGLLQVEVVSVPRFAFTMLMTASAFLALIFALVCILGDAGRMVALILLVLQLAAAGATIPVELTSPFFQAIHPFMPLTWVVQALRVSMFGAFDGAWLHAIGVIAAIDAVCVLAAAWLGRWRLVDEADYQPLIEVD